jgi:hypothetical protein
MSVRGGVRRGYDMRTVQRRRGADTGSARAALAQGIQLERKVGPVLGRTQERGKGGRLGDSSRKRKMVWSQFEI